MSFRGVSAANLIWRPAPWKGSGAVRGCRGLPVILPLAPDRARPGQTEDFDAEIVGEADVFSEADGIRRIRIPRGVVCPADTGLLRRRRDKSASGANWPTSSAGRAARRRNSAAATPAPPRARAPAAPARRRQANTTRSYLSPVPELLAIWPTGTKPRGRLRWRASPSYTQPAHDLRTSGGSAT